MEGTSISGIAKDTNIARISVVGVNDEPGVAFKMFRVMAKEKINIDLIIQSLGRNNTQDISFTVGKDDAEKAVSALEKSAVLKFDHISKDLNVAKVSIVGSGIMSTTGVAATMFEALFNAKVNILMIATSEIKVSVLVSSADADRAVQAIHDKFFG